MNVVPFGKKPAKEYPRRTLRSTGQHREWLYAAFTKRGLTCNEFGVMSVIVHHMNVVTGECWPTCRTLAEATGLSYATVRRIVGRMARRGLIRRERRRHKGRLGSYLYTVPPVLCTACGEHRGCDEEGCCPSCGRIVLETEVL